jgi:hypothetical protein
MPLAAKRMRATPAVNGSAGRSANSISAARAFRTSVTAATTRLTAVTVARNSATPPSQRARSMTSGSRCRCGGRAETNACGTGAFACGSGASTGGTGAAGGRRGGSGCSRNRSRFPSCSSVDIIRPSVTKPRLIPGRSIVRRASASVSLSSPHIGPAKSTAAAFGPRFGSGSERGTPHDRISTGLGINPDGSPAVSRIPTPIPRFEEIFLRSFHQKLRYGQF